MAGRKNDGSRLKLESIPNPQLTLDAGQSANDVARHEQFWIPGTGCGAKLAKVPEPDCELAVQSSKFNSPARLPHRQHQLLKAQRRASVLKQHSRSGTI
jgi:hypothetical protein